MNALFIVEMVPALFYGLILCLVFRSISQAYPHFVNDDLVQQSGDYPSADSILATSIRVSTTTNRKPRLLPRFTPIFEIGSVTFPALDSDIQRQPSFRVSPDKRYSLSITASVRIRFIDIYARYSGEDGWELDEQWTCEGMRCRVSWTPQMPGIASFLVAFDQAGAEGRAVLEMQAV